MQIIKHNISIPLNFRPLIEIDNVCFFDIETMGLSREYHQIYLIGLLYYNNESSDWTLIQLLADDLKEEKTLLLEFLDMVKEFDRLVTYNGDSFDIPFVKKRLERFGTFWDVDNSLDLYRYVRENRNILNLADLKLKTLEKHLGIQREDLISGKECIELYKSYTSTKNHDALKLILRHNYDDLQYMPYLLKIYNIIDRSKTIGINEVEPSVKFYLEAIDFSEEKLMIKGCYDPKLDLPWTYYKPTYTFSLDKDKVFSFTIETKKARLSEDILADIVDTRLVGELNIEDDLSPHDAPKGIIILRANKNIYMQNIELLIKGLFLLHYRG